MHAPIDDNSGNDRGEMVGDGFCGWGEIGVCGEEGMVVPFAVVGGRVGEACVFSILLNFF